MLLYSPEVTPRLLYITDFVGNQVFNEAISVTSDKQRFRSYGKAKINYSAAAITEEEFRITSVGLLFERNITKPLVECFEIDGHKAFFRVEGGDFPFDILAAAFYLLSRYEEYLPHRKDKHGRYAHENSIAFRESFLHLPLVNIWLNDLKKALLLKFQDLDFTCRRFTYLPTYDIDMAYSYLNKGVWRNLGGSLRSVLQGEWTSLRERMNVLMRRSKDPFDSYQWLNDIHLRCRLKAHYFFLLAGKTTAYDKNIPPSNKTFRKLIVDHAAKYKTGIHPSWQSGDHDNKLKEEIQLLESVTGHTIFRSRQHYIRIQLPATYRNLLRSGIKKDYSMGYGTINGFRASAACSFPWYDLPSEEATGLIIYPYCFMDANSFYALKHTPQQAMQEMKNYYDEIKSVGGLMITIWHNNFLGTDRQFAGWKEVYEHFLEQYVCNDE